MVEARRDGGSFGDDVVLKRLLGNLSALLCGACMCIFYKMLVYVN